MKKRWKMKDEDLLKAVILTGRDADAISSIIKKDSIEADDGGKGSGNFGHKGRPGKRGGSSKVSGIGSFPAGKTATENITDKAREFMGKKNLKQATSSMNQYKTGTRVTYSSHGTTNEFVKEENGTWNPVRGHYKITLTTGNLARSIMLHGGGQFDASIKEDKPKDGKGNNQSSQGELEQETPDYDPSVKMDYLTASAEDVKKRMDSMKKKQKQLQQKQDDMQSKMNDPQWVGQSTYAERKALGTQIGKVQEQLDEIWNQQNECDNACKERPDYLQNFYKSKVRQDLEQKGVLNNPPKKIDKKRTQQQIIDEIGGLDKMGSCASLSIVYALSKAGYEIQDFRGGQSRKYFSENFDKITQIQGLKTIREMSEKREGTDLSCSKRVLEKMQQGKQYIFATGRHASVMRKINGKYEYLQLQEDLGYNGWRPLESETYSLDDTLISRFGASGRTTASYLRGAVAIPLNEFANHPQALKIAGYINTNVADQVEY